MSIKIRNLLVAVIVVAVVAVTVVIIKAPAIKETAVFNIPKICVHIKGAVNSPGIYEFETATRVNDAIVAAGGALPDADINAVNLARFLEDGEELIIPAVIQENAKDGNNGNLKININTAGVNELCAVEGISKFIAEQIVRYRTECSEFLTKEEIMNVPGIGKSLYDRIKERIFVN